MDDVQNYQRLIQLMSSQHDTATLAKLFYQSRNIPASYVEKWIQEEVVEPFESSNKGNRFSYLCHKFSTIGRSLSEIGILPSASWNPVRFLIPGTDQKITAKVRKDPKNNSVFFTIDITHEELGKIVIQGIVTLKDHSRHATNLGIVIKHDKTFPQALVESISSEFLELCSYGGLESSINFEEASNNAMTSS